MSLTIKDKILKLVRNLVYNIDENANNNAITTHYEIFLQNLSCQPSFSKNPSNLYFINKINDFLNNSSHREKFIDKISSLTILIGDDGISIYLRFFYEFTSTNRIINLFGHRAPDIVRNMSNISISSFKSIKYEKFQDDIAESTVIASPGVSKKTFERINDMGNIEYGSLQTHEKLFPEIVISKLEKNSQRSPWLLINETLPDGQKESDLVSDLLYNIQGIDGLNIKYDILKQRHYLDPKIDLPSPIKQIIFRICEIGYLFRQLNDFSSINECDDGFNMVKKAFSLSVKSYLNDFVRFVSTIDNGIFSQAYRPSKFSLAQLLVSTMEFQRKFIYLYNASIKCQGLIGGYLLSTIYSFSMTGDPVLSKIGCNLLVEAARPINRMLTDWINEGNLSDPFKEFFITVDSKIGNDRFWVLKYNIRAKMIPAFVSDILAKKILRIGKSINLIKQICKIDYKYDGNFDMLCIESDSQSPISSNLNDIIHQTESRINKYVLDLLFDKYELVMHLDALYRYLMLGQGDFIRQLLELLEPYLSNSADNLRMNNMTCILESAVNSTNAQFDSKEVLQRLDCKLAQSSPGDLGWDVFTLYYHTKGPLEIVVDSRSFDKYLKIFRFLWFIKRSGHLMDYLSKNNIIHHKELRNQPYIDKLIKFINLVKYEMHHFINQLEYFLTFEVLECSNAQFASKIKQAKDLDEIIIAHESFLDNVISLCFLNEESEVIRYKLHEIFKKIIQFESIYRYSIGTITSEIRRTNTDQESKSSNLINSVNYIQNKLMNLIMSFRRLMLDFLHSLMESSNSQHYYLAFRLDFNEYYAKTFQNKVHRKSESFMCVDPVSSID